MTASDSAVSKIFEKIDLVGNDADAEIISQSRETVTIKSNSIRRHRGREGGGQRVRKGGGGGG